MPRVMDRHTKYMIALLHEYDSYDLDNWLRDWHEKGLSVIEKQKEKDEKIKEWVLKNEEKIISLEKVVHERDKKILAFECDNTQLKGNLEKLTKEYEALKLEHQELKDKMQQQENFSKVLSKQKENLIESPADGFRKKKSPPESPNEPIYPEKPKKLRSSWVSVDRDKKSPVDRKPNISLSLSKPPHKLKQTHLNFTKENSANITNHDETFCVELENENKEDIPTKQDPESPSRFRQRKVTKVLKGLKETPKESVVNPFESVSIPSKRTTEIKSEPKSPLNRITRTLSDKSLDYKSSQDSDLMILPTPVPEIMEINDSNDSFLYPVLKPTKSLGSVPKSASITKKEIPKVPEPSVSKVVEKAPITHVPGFCKQCFDYYIKLFPDGFTKDDPFVVPCYHELGRRLRPDTPEGFWNPLFTPTQD